MKNRILLSLIITGLLFSQCSPKLEEWPLPMFTIPLCNGLSTYYTGRNVVFNACYSEDYQENGRLSYQWDFNNDGTFDTSLFNNPDIDGSWDTSLFDNPFVKKVYLNSGCYNIRLRVINENQEIAETFGIINIVDESSFYDNYSYHLMYFPLGDVYLDCRIVHESEDYWWTMKDLAVDTFDYSSSCSANNSSFQYTWANAMQFNIPYDYRLPSRNEWEILFNEFGGIEIAGLVFESPSQSFIEIAYAGKLNQDLECEDVDLKAWYWTSTEDGADSAWAVQFEKDSIDASFIKLPKNEALSVKLFYKQPN